MWPASSVMKVRRLASLLSSEYSPFSAADLGVTVYRDGSERWQESWSAATATHVGGSDPPDPFRTLIRWIRQSAEPGRTSHVRSFDRYFEAKSIDQPAPLFCMPKSPVSREGEA